MDKSLMLNKFTAIADCMTLPIIDLHIARVTDLPEMQALFVASIKHSCQKDYTEQQIEAWTSSVENKALWEERLNRQYFLLAKMKSKMLGFASLENADYLDMMYVHHDHQRQGIADKLLKALENESRRLGGTSIYSNVSKTARPFFERKVFKVVKENKNMIKGVEIINYRMMKALC